MRSKPALKNILRIEWRWAGYRPPSYGYNNRMIDIKRGRRRIRSVK